jgi:hypothetical protein
VTSPLPPRFRDTRSLEDRVSQDRRNLRSLGVGFVGGRFPLVRPLGSDALLGDTGDDEADSVDEILFRNVDNATCLTAGIVTLHLTYTPIDGSLHIRWNGIDQPPTEWILIDKTVTFIAPHLHVGDVITSAYAYYFEESEISPLVLRGASLPINSPTAIPLDPATEIGDLIVVGNATMHYNGAPGGGTPSDARLTQVGHGAWVGTATHLGPVTFADPLAFDTDRHTAAVATFAPPSAYKNDGDVGPGSGPTGTLAAPVVAASGAVLVITNGTIPPNNTVPTGYTVAVHPDGSGLGSNVCQVGIGYWTDVDASTSPAGSIHYDCHTSGFAYATTIGIETAS